MSLTAIYLTVDMTQGQGPRPNLASISVALIGISVKVETLSLTPIYLHTALARKLIRSQTVGVVLF